MALICLTKPVREKLKKLIESGDIDIKKLIEMTPEEKTALFKSVVPERAAEATSERLSKKLGAELSDEQVAEIMKRSLVVEDLKSKIPQDSPSFSKERMDHARAQVDLLNYLEDIQNPDNQLSFGKSIAKELTDRYNAVRDAGNIFDKVLKAGEIVGKDAFSSAMKGIKAALDVSYIARQGFKTFTKDMAEIFTGKKSPKTFSKSIIKSFKAIAAIKSEEAQKIVMDQFRASLIASKYFDKSVEYGLALNVIEDFFPTSLAHKIPAIGRAFSASDHAFTIFSQNSRMAIFENMYENRLSELAKRGLEMTKEEGNAIAFVANSITSRGSLGVAEPLSGALNTIFYSARFVRSQVDTFIMPFNTKLTPFARQEALKSSLATLGMIGTLMATASQFTDVEWNPLSSQFGKARLPGTNRWVDLTAGTGSYMTLLARMVEQKTKSTSTGKITKLGTGKYGSQTFGDIFSNFFSNKLSPSFQVLNDVAFRGTTFFGKQPTVGSELSTLAVPMTPQNMYDYFTNTDLATALIGSVAEAVGIATTNYDFNK